MLDVRWGEIMEKRIVIAGCRDYTDYDAVKEFLTTKIINQQKQTKWILLSGRSRGADRLGERFAQENGWEIETFPAAWERYGRAAGPIRNKTMVDICDAVICFWDGKSKGTASLIRLAKKAKKPLYIKMIERK